MSARKRFKIKDYETGEELHPKPGEDFVMCRKGAFWVINLLGHKSLLSLRYQKYRIEWDD